MSASSRPGLVVIVTPGPATAWAYNLVNVLAERSRIAVRAIDRQDAIDTDQPSTIHICQYPSKSVIDAIETGALDAILVVEDPLSSIAHTMGSQGRTFLEALRSLTASWVANLAIGRTSRSRLVFPAYEQPALNTARRLAAGIGINFDHAVMADMVALLAPGIPVQTSLIDTLRAQSPDLRFADLGDTERETVRKVAEAALDMAQGSTDRPIIWPSDVYLSGDRPNEPAPMIAPVMGPSRVMLYGPYLHLPPADFRAQMIVAFSGRIEEVPFLIEIHAGSQCLGRYRIQGRRSGGYRGWFNFRTEDPVAPIEIHFRNERGSIEGEVALVELAFYAEASGLKDFS